jgi:DnaK suppressor protein
MDADQARTELLDERRRFEQVARSATTEQSERETEQAGLPGQHAPDQGVDTADWLDDQGMRADAERQLEEIDAALARIDAGTWGTCEVCGRQIDAERLEARPRAVRCLEHQEQAERSR